MNKDSWIAEGAGHIPGGDSVAAFDNSSRIEPKRPRQWLPGIDDSELFPNKKQNVEDPNSKSTIEIFNVPGQGNTPIVQVVPNEYIKRWFGPKYARYLNLPEPNIPPVGTYDARGNGIGEEDAPVGLTISNAMEDPEAPCFSFCGIREAQVNQVQDINNGVHAQRGHGAAMENNDDLSTGLANHKENQIGYTTIGQAYGKEHENVPLMGHTHNTADAHVRSTDDPYGNGDGGNISLPDTSINENGNRISFDGFPADHEISLYNLDQLISDLDQSINRQSSVQIPEAASEKQLNALDANEIAAPPRVPKSKPEAASKKKAVLKTSKRGTPNSFPSSIRTLKATGMFDEVPVKYVSATRENKDSWMAKGAGHIPDGDAAFDVAGWGNTPSIQVVPNEFNERSFGSKYARYSNLADRNIPPVRTNDARRNGIGEDASVGLTMSRAMEDPETPCFSNARIRKVQDNQVQDINNGVHAQQENGAAMENNIDLSAGLANHKENQISYTTIGQAYGKERENVPLMGHTHNMADAHVRSTDNPYGNGDGGNISLPDTYSNENGNRISFDGFPADHEISLYNLDQLLSDYDQSCNRQSSVRIPEAASEKQLNAPDANEIEAPPRVPKSKPEAAPKTRPGLKTSKRGTPNSFPSSVRTLIATGMLEGVPVKYVSVTREERGVIKGSGYLCGCESCDYSEVLTAHEFGRHAGCTTKNPNDHIFFENGKTIYQTVRELRSTPHSLLFDAVQTIFGAPVNQEAFSIWKESFRKASRELQRIYGKEQKNLYDGCS